VTAGSLNEAETKVIKLTHIKYSTPTPNTNKTKDKKISVRNFSRRNTSSSSKKASLDNMTTIESFSSVNFQQDHKVKAKSVLKMYPFFYTETYKIHYSTQCTSKNSRKKKEDCMWKQKRRSLKQFTETLTKNSYFEMFIHLLVL